MPLSATNVRSRVASKYSGTGYVPLAASTEVEAEEADMMSEALAKLMTDGRMMDGGTGVPAGPNYVGGCEQRPNNQSEEEVFDAGQGDEVGGEEDDGARWRCWRGDHGSGQSGK